MDNSRHILVLSQPDEATWVHEVLARIQRDNADWKDISVVSCCAQDVNPEEIGNVDLVVIGSPMQVRGNRMVRDLVDAFAEARVPVIAAYDSPDEPAGIHADIHIDRSTTAELLATQISVLLDRQQIINQMSRELAIAQRFQGGLRGEISRMHEELQLAALVQQEFLPGEPPSLYGMEFAAMWRPANYVSGDIYDIARLDEDHIGVFIADAVGHGVPAALMTMVIARALPTKEVDGHDYRLVPPDEALHRLNQEMIRRQGDTTRFATACYALINCRNRVATIAGAGHPPPLLFRAGAAAVELETPGGLLGVFDDETFGSVEVEIHQGDRLVMYSDGFEVAFPAEEEDGFNPRMPTKQYLTEFAELARLDSPAEMILDMGRRVDAQPGSLHQTDDLTLICMHAGQVDATEPHHVEAERLQELT